MKKSSNKKQTLIDAGFTKNPASSKKSQISKPTQEPQTKTNRVSPGKAQSLHASTKRAKTLKKPTVKNRRSHPSAIITKGQKTRAGTINSDKLKKATSLKAATSVSRYSNRKKRIKTSKVTIRESEPVAPIISKVTRAAAKPSRSLVQEGISRADSYTPELRTPKQGRGKTSKPLISRLSSKAAMAMSAALLVGYVTYLNIPNIALRVAASQAGFSAKMPSYNPTGFSYTGPINYSKGEISINFSSKDSDKDFTIIERKSNWDSQSLLNNYVKEQSEPYLTFYERGLTVYILNEDSAAWVNGGIWYTVEGDSLLNSEQLLKIASSL